MTTSIIALFGEAQKGDLGTIYFCKSLPQLFDFFGEPPEDTEGLFHAIQVLLYGKQLIYFRVPEEGTSTKEYLFGLDLLRQYSSTIPRVDALFLPQVGSHAVLEEGIAVCRQHKSLLLMRPTDFYDYLTDKPTPTQKYPPHD